jgi:hypothetical protein
MTIKKKAASKRSKQVQKKSHDHQKGKSNVHQDGEFSPLFDHNRIGMLLQNDPCGFGKYKQVWYQSQ